MLTLSLDTRLGIRLHIPFYFHLTSSKVNLTCSWLLLSRLGNVWNKWELIINGVYANRKRWCLRPSVSVHGNVLFAYLKQVKFIPFQHTCEVRRCFLMIICLCFSWWRLPGRQEWQRSLQPDSFTSSWVVDSKLAAELCSRSQNYKDKLPCRWVATPAHLCPFLSFIIHIIINSMSLQVAQASCWGICSSELWGYACQWEQSKQSVMITYWKIPFFP